MIIFDFAADEVFMVPDILSSLKAQHPALAQYWFGVWDAGQILRQRWVTRG